MKMGFYLFLMAGFFLSPHARAAVDPASMVMNIYAAWVSPNTDCTGAINLFDGGTTPISVDMAKAPTIGGGSPPDGTYNCIIFKMSSVITFIPATSELSCAAGTTYTHSLCRADNAGTTTPFDGTSFKSNVACVGTKTDVPATDNTIYLYLSTGSTGKSQSFLQPTSSNLGYILGSPFVVNGSTAGTFVFNGSGQVDGNNGKCKMNAPAFSFR